MTTRGLKIALAASVALNLFAAAAGVTAWTAVKRHEARVAEARAPAARGSLREVVAGLSPEVRDRVRESLRASARAARPDFEAARTARREAVRLSAEPNLDTAAIARALEASRTAEVRGRARLEADSVSLLATLGPADRAALSVLLTRRGGGGDRGSKRMSPKAETGSAPAP